MVGTGCSAVAGSSVCSMLAGNSSDGSARKRTTSRGGGPASPTGTRSTASRCISRTAWKKSNEYGSRYSRCSTLGSTSPPHHERGKQEDHRRHRDTETEEKAII